MKKLLLATVSAVAMIGAANAADLRPSYKALAAPPPPIWAGGYIGIIGGVVRHDADFVNFSCLGGFGCGTSANDTGGTVGGLLGWNGQSGSFVYGVEGDVSWVGAKASAAFGSPFPGGLRTRFESDIEWLATIRGRMGLAFDSTLVYLTGGVAIAGVDNSFTVLNPNGTFNSGISDNETKVGWTIGVGVEHMLGRNWTVKAEARYVDLGKKEVGCTSGTFVCTAGTGYRGEFSNTLMMGLVGLNYKF